MKQKELKKKLRVSFTGEPGLVNSLQDFNLLSTFYKVVFFFSYFSYNFQDMGGLTKEWFQLLIREIFQASH